MPPDPVIQARPGAVSKRPANAYAVSVMESEDSDEALMSRYCRGDADAFEPLYHRHKGALYRYMLRHCGSAAVADELFQDVWARLIAARDSYRVTARFTTYLYRIAHNRLVDYYRRQSASPLRPVNDHDPEVPGPGCLQPEQGVHAEQRIHQLMSLLAALPREQREAFLLREEAGLSVAQIAEVTGAGQETAKSRLRYALQRLREGLREWL